MVSVPATILCELNHAIIISRFGAQFVPNFILSRIIHSNIFPTSKFLNLPIVCLGKKKHPEGCYKLIIKTLLFSQINQFPCAKYHQK